ncbi:oxidoreductase [Pseudomonas chlororaphis]|nr:oxidoreductase [Pseudomonas chlororaphis]
MLQSSLIESLDLNHLKVAVIGGTGGIGRAFSRLLASRGASVVVVGQKFRDINVPRIEFIAADLSLLSEAKRISSLLSAETLDLLIFTAGIFAGPRREETAEGIERDLAVSYLSRFVILREIASHLGTNRSAGRTKSRVIVVAYPGSGKIGNPDDFNSKISYKPIPAHMNTVAGNEALVLDAVKRYPNLTFVGLNPGLIKSNIRSNMLGAGSLKLRLMEWIIGLISQSADTYAERLTPLLISTDIEVRSGAMFDKKGQAIQPSPGMTELHMNKLLSVSEALVASAGIQLTT